MRANGGKVRAAAKPGTEAAPRRLGGRLGRRLGGRHVPGRAALLRAVLGGVILSSVALWPVAAGSDEPARPFTLGLDLRFEADSNPGLTSPSPGTRTGSTARLNFGWVTDTGVDRFSVDAAASLRAFGGRGRAAGDISGFREPRVGVGYIRSGADGSFQLSARWREDSIRSLRGLDEFLDPETGLIELPEDFDALVGTGTRRNRAANARLSIGENATLGFVLGAGVSATDYRNAAPSLIPATRTRADATARLRLNPVATATAGLRYARFDPRGGASRTTTGLTLGYAQDLPTGQFGLDGAADFRPEGTRLSASVRWRMERPRGGLGLSLGLARPAGGSRVRVISSLNWRQDLPGGSLSAQFQNSVDAGSDDTDRVLTALAVNWTHEVGPLSTLSLDARHAVSSRVGVGQRTASTTLGATYTHALTQDWGMSVGYNHRIRRETGTRARGDTVFLTLRRTWN